MNLFRQLAFSFLLISCISQCHVVAAGSSTLFAANLPDRAGKPQKLSAYMGKPLIVNFWARWCAPCREEIPELNRLHERRGKQVAILGIGLEDSVDEVKTFEKKLPMKYPVFLGGDQAIPLMIDLGNKRGGLPYTVFIDAKGNVIGEKLGRLTSHDLEKAARQLLGSSP